jgi:ABC-type multidrug transport system fused ATPase/permease subunit
VLRGLSLRIPKGQVAALVGPSGGGKSSLIKLVERFYDPSVGSILIDGRPLAAYSHTWLRRRIALVGQVG